MPLTSSPLVLRKVSSGPGAREAPHTSSPLSLCRVWTPLLPVLLAFLVVFQALLFGAEVLMLVYDNHRGRGDLPASSSVGGYAEVGKR